MSEWHETTLGALADVRVSNVDKKSNAGEIPVRLCNYMDVYSSNVVGDFTPFMHATATSAEVRRFGLNAGDVVITKDSETPNDIGIPAFVQSAGPDVVCGYHLAILRPKEQIDGRFLVHQLQLPRVAKHFARHATGSTRFGLSLAGIKTVQLLVPEDMNEQRRIADLLSAVDEQIALLERRIDKVCLVRDGVLRDALARLADAPRKPLAKVAEVGSGVTLGRKFSGPGTRDYPYLRVANVQDGHIDLNEVKTIRLPGAAAGRAMLRTGDVLMNEGGDFDKLGRSAVWNGEIQDCLHQNHVFRVRCDRDVLLPEFLALWAASEFGKKYFMLASKQSTNLASINSTQLKEFPVLLPTLDEQRDALQVVGAIAEELERDRREVEKLLLQKQGLAQDLLTGKERVSS